MRGAGEPGKKRDTLDIEIERPRPHDETSGEPSHASPGDDGQDANEDFLFHLYRGSELLQDNRVHEAKEELERALNLQPRDAKGQDLLAVVYFRLGLYPRAIAIYEQLRATNPRDTALLLNLALCYLKTGQAALAKRDLEALVALNPSHTRAWGYLGLACDRLGELNEAELAFGQGGHAQMARRVQTKRSSLAAPAAPSDEAIASRDLREVARAAFEELDAGELSFALAEPASEPQAGEGHWRPVELGLPGLMRPRTANPDMSGGGGYLHVPKLGGPPTEERRPTLIVGVAPAAHEDEVAAVRVPSHRAPPYAVDEGGVPSLRHTIAAADAEAQSRDAFAKVAGADAATYAQSTQPHGVNPGVLAFPKAGQASLHPSGIGLVQLSPTAGFSVRLEAIRACTSSLELSPVDRARAGQPAASASTPVVHAIGDGQLVLGARAGRKLSALTVADVPCFLREDLVVAWTDALSCEVGRLATSEWESLTIVQFRGLGPLFLEHFGELLCFEVHPSRGMSVRREVIVGWFGRLVPRALSPNEAPGGQRGLVSLAGEGRVLVTSG